MAEKRGTQETTPQTERAKVERQSAQPTGREGMRQRGLTRRTPFAPSPYAASPFGLMSSFADEMERLFEDFGFGRGWMTPFSRRGPWPRGLGEAGQSMWSPDIEAFEREGQLIVRADLPGLKKGEVKVDITDDALTIQGERKHEHEECDEGFCHTERSFGSFYRSIPLPEGVDADKAKASFLDGVLEVAIPLPERAQRRRRIEIGEGSEGEERPRARSHTTSK